MVKNLFLFLVSFLALGACKSTEEKYSPRPVQGWYAAKCLQEGVMDTAKADTSLVITINKDSIAFSKQRIANCCGWFDSLGLRLDHDTLRVVNNDRDGILSACDCNCLFQEWITLHRVYYDSIRVVDFNGRFIHKYETEINE